ALRRAAARRRPGGALLLRSPGRCAEPGRAAGAGRAGAFAGALRPAPASAQSAPRRRPPRHAHARGKDDQRGPGRRHTTALGLAAPVLPTTLDPGLQAFVQRTRRQRVRTLAGRGVGNGAAVVVDNQTGAVLAWAVAPEGNPYAIDPVVTPRQPGSALKPFV